MAKCSARRSTAPRSILLAILAAGLLLALAFITPRPALAQDATPTPTTAAGDGLAATPVPGTDTTTFCLSCHGNPDLSLTLPSGETVSLFVSREMLENSVHAQIGIECQACHPDIHDYPHPSIDFQNREELSRSYYEACQRCHSQQYEETQDSIHAHIAAAGNLEAPICTDCHGAHQVENPHDPQKQLTEICGKCHTNESEQYAHSVHGVSLVEENNPDVPVCTDCHGVHNIVDPRTEQFHVETPELCAGCHADPELMGKYGIRSDVYDVYALSWHGVDVSVYEARWPTLWHQTAVCTDCHGTHDILRTDNPASRVHPDNLLVTCQQCHPGVSPQWTSAWTGHYQVSLERTPFVFYTQAFYEYFAYAILWISAIYVLLQIVRATVARVRRSW